MIEKARELFREARSLCVLTGAGVSAESGVPTFRGKDGLWKNHNPMELATWDAFTRDPKLVWEWYQWRRGLIRKCEPNPSHQAIRKMEEMKEDFLLITQNVDGLHRKAGTEKLVEIHGNIWEVRCVGCGWKEEVFDDFEVLPPRCGHCGELLRPNVVWFGEAIPEDALRRSFEMLDRCDLLIVAGTSGVVQPAASFAGYVLRRGGSVIEVNLEETPNTPFVTIFLKGKAGEVL
ncbi:MAG: NAD-dependent deacylase, partial [Deltaproteobacteria bacterium]